MQRVLNVYKKGCPMTLAGAFRLLRKPLAVAAVIATLFISSEANAGWRSRYAPWGGSSGGSSSGGSSGGVPEIDAGAAAGAVTLLTGGIFLLRDRLNARKKNSEE